MIAPCGQFLRKLPAAWLPEERRLQQRQQQGSLVSSAEAPLSSLPWLHRPSHSVSVLQELPCPRCCWMGCSGPALDIPRMKLEGDSYLSGSPSVEVPRPLWGGLLQHPSLRLIHSCWDLLFGAASGVPLHLHESCSQAASAPASRGHCWDRMGASPTLVILTLPCRDGAASFGSPSLCWGGELCVGAWPAQRTWLKSPGYGSVLQASLISPFKPDISLSSPAGPKC